MTVDSPELVDSDYAAAWLRVNVATINRKCRKREIPGAFKFGHRWLMRKDLLESLFDPSSTTGGSLDSPSSDATTAIPSGAAARGQASRRGSSASRADMGSATFPLSGPAGSNREGEG